MLKIIEVEHCHKAFVEDVFGNCFLVWHLKIVVVCVRYNNDHQNSMKITLKTITYNTLHLLKLKDFGDLKPLKILKWFPKISMSSLSVWSTSVYGDS